MAGDGSRPTARVAALLSRARPRRRTVLAGGTAFAVAGPLALAAVLGAGNPAHVIEQTSGSAWVVSPAQGLATLLDGASEQVVAGVRVPGAGHALRIAQDAAGAYLVDADEGTVARLDAATYDVGTPVALGTPGGGLSVLQNDPGHVGRHVVHVLDTAARTATRVDPRTLRVLEEVTLTAQPGPGQAVVDRAGDLWAVDASAGTLTRVAARDGERTVRRTEAATDTARLVLVRGAPVLVDSARAAVHVLGADARTGAGRCLDTRPDDDVQVLGSATRDEVYVAVTQTRSLLVTSTTSDDCTRKVDLTGVGGDPAYGALAQSGRYVFVPDSTSGTTAVVDTEAGTVLDHVALAAPGNRLELHGRDGFVFFNDLDGEVAGVLTLRDGVWAATALEKYDRTTGEATEVVVPEDERTDGAGGEDDEQAESAGGEDDQQRGGQQRDSDATAAQDNPGDADGASGATGPGSSDTDGPADSGPPASTRTPEPVASVTPSPSSSPAGPLHVELSTDPPPVGQPESQPNTPAVIVPVVTGASPDAIWTWTVTSAASEAAEAPQYTLPPDGEPLVLDSVGNADVTVHLDVRDGERHDEDDLVLWVKYPCHITVNGTSDGSRHVVDLRSGAPGTFTVEARECRGEQTAVVTRPPWLAGPAQEQITVAGEGASTTVTLSLAGAAPGDGRQSGTTVRLTGVEPSQPYPIAVETDVPPEIVSARSCWVVGPLGPPPARQVIAIGDVTVVVRDAEVGDSDGHVVTGDDNTTDWGHEASGVDHTYRHIETIAGSTPPSMPGSITVSDAFGKVAGPFEITTLGAACPSS